VKSAATAAAVCDVAGIHSALERFLKLAARPSILEPGEEFLDVTPDTATLDLRGNRLTLHAWNETRNLVRRVTGLEQSRPGRIELIVERFGRKQGRLWIVDRDFPGQEEMTRKSDRLVSREKLRRLLARYFPEWKLVEASAETDLEQSLSPAFPRAYLRRGTSGLAAITTACGYSDAAEALSFGLLWLDYLRRRERRVSVGKLVLFLPAGAEATVRHRLRWLDPQAAQYELWTFTEDETALRQDPRDRGNLETHLEPLHRVPVPVDPLVQQLGAEPQVETVEMSGSTISLRVRGLEFARTAGGELFFGVHERTPMRPHHLKEVKRLAAGIAAARDGRRPQPRNPLYSLSPEAWLESQVRRSIETIDSALGGSPIYTHVPACLAGQRGVLDLLSVDNRGQLAILELKASGDLHLPLQALDYWTRVLWHLERDEFRTRGYFPGVALSGQRPRILLVSPALDFHPTTEIILNYISKDVEIERVGVNSSWREKLEVMFRARGADSPC
jgi:hypothetical protein